MSAVNDLIDAIGTFALLSAVGVGMSWAFRVPGVRGAVVGAMEKQGKKIAEAAGKAGK
jgi:hypothetical protein